MYTRKISRIVQIQVARQVMNANDVNACSAQVVARNGLFCMLARRALLPMPISRETVCAWLCGQQQSQKEQLCKTCCISV